MALAAAALLLLGAGYADLARGGITLSALCLTAAYCMVIPVAIWWGAGAAAARGVHRPPYAAAALAGLAVLILYVTTLAPSTAFWDASEYIAASYGLGIPHPPGNPLFVLLGRTATLLPVAPTIAQRVNLLSAAASAVSAGLWFLVAHRVLAAWLAARWQRLGGAALATLVGATAFTVWNQSVVTEKVYLVALAGIALVSWLAVCWLDAPPGARADRLLVLAAYLIGLGYANQMAGVIPAPCLALAVLAHRPRTALRGRLLAACAAAALLGATPFATQPIRAAFHPALNEGEPTACRRGLAWDCTFSRGTWTAFKYNLDRKQYNKGPLADRQAPLAAQVGMWWEYFRWQWLRDPRGERPALQGGVAIAFLALGLAGGWTHWRRHRASWWYFAPLTVLLSLGLVYYMNFKYGATQAPALGDLVPREVRDRDYFFVWSFSAWGVWVALGLVRAWEAATRGGRARRAVLVAATGAVSAAALVPLAANWRSASRRGDHTAIAFARDLLNSVEPHGVLVTGGDNDTFPLWYAQEVERVRPDVTVFLLELLNTDWYVRGLLYRAPRAYDEARGPALYRGLGRALPRRPVLDLTLEQADAVPLYTRVAEPVTLTLGGLRTTLDPARLPQDDAGGGVLLRSDLLLLRMIADTWPERAVYVSRTAGDVAGRLGLGERMLTQGLVRKLVAPDAAHGDVVPSEGGGALDLARTRALWTQVYGFPAALARRGDWADRPSASIPLVYSITGAELAQVLAARGDAATSRRVLADVRTLARASRDEALLAWLAGRGG